MSSNRVCVDYTKLNVVTIKDAFLLPFTDDVLQIVDGHEMCNVLDSLSSYNQFHMHLDDQEKSTFVTNWGVFVTVVVKIHHYARIVRRNHRGSCPEGFRVDTSFGEKVLKIDREREKFRLHD